MEFLSFSTRWTCLDGKLCRRVQTERVRVVQEEERARESRLTVLICAEPDGEGMLGRLDVGLRVQVAQGSVAAMASGSFASRRADGSKDLK